MREQILEMYKYIEMDDIARLRGEKWMYGSEWSPVDSPPLHVTKYPCMACRRFAMRELCCVQL